MYGEAPACVFLVFANAGAGGDEALARWYTEIHGPDAFSAGTFSALHRYQAAGAYDARFLAVWEGAFASRDEVRARMAPRGAGPPDRSRIITDLIVVWSAFAFRTGPTGAVPGHVGTLTLVEGGSFDMPGAARYRYGDVDLYESADGPQQVAARWAGLGQEGMAPHGPYRTIFEDPGAWPPAGEPVERPYISHWRPLASLRKEATRPTAAAGMSPSAPEHPVEER